MSRGSSLVPKAFLAGGIFVGGLAGTGFLLTVVWVLAADIDGTGTGPVTAVAAVVAFVWTAIWATALIFVVADAKRQGAPAARQDA